MIKKYFIFLITIFPLMAFVVPRDFNYFYQKGFEAIEQGNHAAAIYYLDSAILLEPQADTAYSLIANPYYNLGKIDQAIEYSNKALAINPKNPFAYFYRAISTALIDVTSDSLTKEVKKHRKDSVWLTENIRSRYYIATYEKNGYSGIFDYRKAIEDLTTSIHIDSTLITNYSYRAVYYHYLGQMHKAKEDYDYSIQYEPKNPYNYLNRGVFNEQYGRPDWAISDYTKGIELDSNMADLYEKRGLLYVNRFRDKEYGCKDLTKATLLGKYIENLDEYCMLNGIDSLFNSPYVSKSWRHDYQSCYCPPKPVFNPDTDTIREIEISPGNVMEIWDIKDSEKTTWEFDDGRVIEVSKETKRRWLKEEEEKRRKELMNTP